MWHVTWHNIRSFDNRQTNYYGVNVYWSGWTHFFSIHTRWQDEETALPFSKRTGYYRIIKNNKTFNLLSIIEN
jgi:hypothetical protein